MSVYLYYIMFSAIFYITLNEQWSAYCIYYDLNVFSFLFSFLVSVVDSKIALANTALHTTQFPKKILSIVSALLW